MSKQEMAAGYAWKQTLSGSGQWDVKLSFGGGGRENSDLNIFTPPTWACISLQQNHTNTHRSTSLCTGFKNISSIQRGQIALLPTISRLHSQLSQAAHYTHNLNTETVCCIVFLDLIHDPATSKPEEDKKIKEQNKEHNLYRIMF